jgi:DNA-binding CsgD family transcriptional regulator
VTQFHHELDQGRSAMVAGMSDDRPAALSRRELEVAELVAQGWTNREIAEHLFISPRTVESHLDHVKSKLGLSRRPHIVAWALRQRAGDVNSSKVTVRGP